MYEIEFDWVDFYKEFAGVLAGYKNKRPDLVDKVKHIYANTGISMPKLDDVFTDIDPFTVFGLFNKSSMKEINRIKIISAIKDLFEIKAQVPTSFGSIPVLNNQNATYYYFVGQRGEKDIDNLWDLFESALNYANDPNDRNRKLVSQYFDLVINTKGNGNSKVTMGLYWIAPESYLNLDSRNEWYIYESGKIPADIVNKLPKIETKIPAEKYFDIVEIIRTYLSSNECSLKDYKELSYEAWKYSEEINKQNRLEKDNENKGSGLGDQDVDETHYWIYSPGTNASKWDDFSNEGVMGIGWEELGDLSAFNSRKEMQDKMKDIWGPDKSYKMDSLATWQFANDIKVGDVIYAKKGMYKVVGRGVVTSDYFYNEDVPEGEYRHYRKVDWKDIGEWPHPGQAVMKTLTDITSYTDYVQKLEALFIDDDDEAELVEEAEKTWPVYSKTKFLEEVYMDEDTYNTLTGLIDTKKNVILQGAPGVGKTYAANRLAYSIMGEKNKDRVMMVQFHQSYSYEDFIEGFRPASEGSGFEIKKGSFYNFCKKAADDLENKYFFIIDEINRGNLSKIFGELFMLIEKDKRGNSLQLLYSDEKFFVPQNVYIIGMMNTADRSLAMLDYALRRRFAFFEIKPAFDQARFIEYRMGLDNAKFNSLIECVKKLNEKIKEDPSLGEGFCIGHSYFCDLKDVTDAILNGIVEYELVPLLKEYWFDDQTMVRDWTEKLRSSIK
nr:AAA family ATPase [Clostridia bacterium]